MAGWHHWLDGHESEWIPGVGDGQGGLACCDSWGREESDTTEWLIWSDVLEGSIKIKFLPSKSFNLLSAMRERDDTTLEAQKRMHWGRESGHLMGKSWEEKRSALCSIYWCKKETQSDWSPGWEMGAAELASGHLVFLETTCKTLYPSKPKYSKVPTWESSWFWGRQACLARTDGAHRYPRSTAKALLTRQPSRGNEAWVEPGRMSKQIRKRTSHVKEFLLS